MTKPSDLAALPSRSSASLLLASSPRARDLGLLLLRLGFGAALAFAHGLGKLQDPARFIGGLTTREFPAAGLFGWAAILSELVGGLLLAVGLLTRPAAALVLITLSVAAFHVHGGDPFAKRELALAYALVAVVLLLTGPGRYSADARLFVGARDASRASSPGERGESSLPA